MCMMSHYFFRSFTNVRLLCFVSHSDGMTSCQSSSAENVSCNVVPFFYHHSVVIQHLVSDRRLSLISMIITSHMQKIIQIYPCLLKLSRKQESVTDGCYYYIPSLLSREDKNIDIQIYNYSNTILPLVLCFPLGNLVTYSDPSSSYLYINKNVVNLYIKELLMRKLLRTTKEN